MAKGKTKVLNSEEVVAAQKCEQPAADVQFEGKYERVEFKPVEELEKLAKVGFVCERVLVKEIMQPLYRLACEVNRGDDIDGMPVALTPWLSAESLSDMLQGVLFLQPLVLSYVKKYQKPAEEPKEE